jgi:hypothetical protein
VLGGEIPLMSADVHRWGCTGAAVGTLSAPFGADAHRRNTARLLGKDVARREGVEPPTPRFEACKPSRFADVRGPPLPALAVGEVVVWERGTLSGSDLYTSPTTGQVSGAAVFTFGEDDVLGVDYFSQNPGSFFFTGSGTFSGALSGTFRFPTSGTRAIYGGISAIFPVAPAVFQVGSRLEVDGSIDPLLIDPPLAAFPDTLADPRVAASLTVTEILFASGIPVGFTFRDRSRSPRFMSLSLRPTQSASVPLR